MESDYGDDGEGGRYSKETVVCSDIIEKYQKKRFDQLKKDTGSGITTFTDLVNKDM